MTLVCLGYRKGFVEAARQRGLALHFIVEKMKSGLSGLSCTKVADLADTEEVLRAALAAVGTGITGVVTGHEQALFTAAALRSALKLPGDTHLLRCLRFRDKQIQKQSLSAAVPRARCTYLPRENPSFARLAEQLDAKGRPVVVKPADGHGAQATRLVSGQTELDAYVSQFPVRSDVQTVAECFVEGEEIHVDGIWSRGEPRWLSVSTYLGPLMGWHEGAAIGDAPLGGAEPELDARARRFATQVLTELDAPDTVFHLEAFVRPDGELVLGEVAARMVGALTAEVLELTYGIDLYGAAVDLALGRTPALPAEPAGPADLFGFVYLTRSPDHELSEASFRKRFDLIELDYPAVDEGRRGSYGRWGHAIASAPTHQQLVDELRAIAAFNRGPEGAEAR
ncbi:ATP-grasp domain-containing protein [Streptomyces sp. NBC_01221]|uniref:ATP-grasp domain-containing protein n=1 Tax=unclassified Streptomyces TaxID=2593676 RepID=UPI0022526B4D|nr:MULTISPECIES: ATP-grasp domain-containing protein [unclassified Streptomyces]MCX4789026.1 ATP-grasp domain-containing protein [Streptomyces sp. NBC_01221]MCX4795228.1 ATP-grasp domain-containing protein [Streptomyces sp. NBC_01242]WSJ36541.1 ATP-grasp domain-containing protein [Streptomyces sp. NBC_01321]